MKPEREPRRQISGAVGVFVLVLLTLQIFLLTVAVDALLADDPGLAWVAAACSTTLAVGSFLFARYLRS
jgi:hypothetical protein